MDCCSDEMGRHFCYHLPSRQLLQEQRRRSRRWIRRNGSSSPPTTSRKHPSSMIKNYNPGVLFLVIYLAASLSFTVFMEPSTYVDYQSGIFVTGLLDNLPRSQRRRSIAVPSQIYQRPPSKSSPIEEPESGDDDGRRSTMTKVSSSPSSSSSSSSSIEQQELKSLKEQAAQLRREAEALQNVVQQSKLEKKRAEQEKVDGWIEELLIEARFGCEVVEDDYDDDNDDGDNSDDNVSQSETSSSNASPSSSEITRSSFSSSSQSETELLKNVDQVLERLRDDRYSAEQINKIFRRLCEIRPQESRSNLSPMMELLVDAACKLDCQERDENPNKRWNGRVERLLRKKLFARDWNIELRDEDEIDAENPWKV
mmetsp:Transcript_10977/g.26138  ORF Transcript_10977/g.26138 Transcript_10977/m.26138 type:complete len:368 (+) Transcript_10977:97-1200(+)